MSTENMKGFDLSISSGHDTLITGHGGGGGSQVPLSTVVTIRAASTFPPFPSVTVTRTSCAPRGTFFKSHMTDLPFPEMVPSVVEYWNCSSSPSGSVAFTSRSTTGLSKKSGWNSQALIVALDEVKDSIDGDRLRSRRGFCSEAANPATSGITRANKMINRRFTGP